MEHKVLLVLLLVAIANAGPLASRHGRGGCAGRCSKPELPSAFRTGRAYTFDYSTDMRTHIRGASEESSGLRLTARVVFDFLTPCEVAMRLERVRVMELDPAEQPARWHESPHQSRYASELTMSDAHFVLVDGVVPEVCADIDEPEWVLNIKKAIISLIQNTNARYLNTYEGVETDISGQCKVTYNVERDNLAPGVGVSVTKVTDLMSCLDQQKVHSSFQSSSYRATARIQSMPLTKGNRTCHAQYDPAGHLRSAQCSEEHVFRPFSTETAGAVTTVDQKMTLVGVGGMIRIAHDHRFRRGKLEYQHNNYKLPSEQPVEDVKTVLSSLCDLGPAIVPKAPVLFNELVYRLRELSTEQLASVRMDVENHAVCRRNNQMAKQFFFDALPAVTTAPVAQMMRELILNGQVSTAEADAWLTSLAFVQEPRKEMLQSLLPLLEVAEPRTQAMLGVSALVHQYCKSNPECKDEPVVQSISAAIKKLIGPDCSQGDRKTTLVALKAVANAGQLSDLLPIVVQCATKESNLMEVRVAAIEALRRTPCTVDRLPLMRLIRNADLDSELRITAYLGLMACPNIEVFDTVKELLTAESSNQFASFVWTHLTNLLETSDPHKQDVRLIVEDVKLKKQFDMDKLKFSRNIEKSFFSNYLNAGAKVESNLIWSQKSFLPRSATLNMTLDLFGKSLNFLEVGGRAQGLEALLEKYLGSKSNSTGESDTKGQLAQLDNTFKLIEEKIGGNLDIKIFGHQVAFFDLWKEDLEKSGRSLFELLNSLRQIREINWYKSISFLDTRVTIPTISGFPLRLGVNGTASFILKASSKLNLKKLMQWPPAFEMEGKLVPSGAVHVSGMLGISTIFGDYGVKMVSNVYSNTEMQATIKANKGEELQVKIQQPRERQDILNVKTSFFVVHRSIEREQIMRKDLTVGRKSCSGGGVLESLLGVEFCSEVRYPVITADTPQAPIAAGFELDVVMSKRDRHTGYVLHLVNKKDNGNRHWKALLDMPGSTRDRKLQLEFKFDSENNKLQGILVTPWKKGKTELTVGSEGISLLAEVDDVTYISAKAGFKLVDNSEQVRMELNDVELRLLNSKPIKFQGAFGYKKLQSGKNMELSGKLENLLTNPVEFRSSMILNNNNAGVSVYLSSPVFNGKVDSKYDFGGDGVIGSTSLAYQFGDRTEQTIKIDQTIKLTLTSGGHDLRSSLKLTLSELPHYNTHLSVLFKRSNYNHELDLNWEHGRRGQQRRLYSKYDVEKTSNSQEHKLTSFVSYMEEKYGVESTLKHDLGWSQIVSTVVLTSGTEKVATSLDFSREPGTLFYAVTLKSGFAGDLVSKLQRFSDKGSVVFETTLSIFDTDYSVKAELLQKGTKHKMSGSLSLPQMANVMAELSIDASTTEPSLAAKVVIPTATYSADAAAKFEDQKVAMSAKVAGPGVDVQTKVQLSSDDEQKQALAELYWDPRRRQTDGFKLNGSFQTVRKAHLLERIGRLEVSTPNGAIAIRLNERNEPLSSNKYVELEYGNGQKVSANFMYSLNDGWTEKGIIAMLRLVTPFRRYEEITLKLNGYGSLRVRKLEIESTVNDRRFKADLLINLGNINNFHSRLSFVTPWAQASFIQFELNHWLTSTEIKSKLGMEFKTKKIILDVHGYNKGSYGSRDVGLKLQTDSTLKWMPKVVLDLSHKDDFQQFNSKANLAWGNGPKVMLSSDFNFYPSQYGVESIGNITFGTSFSNYKAVSLVWSHKNTAQMIKTSSSLTYKPGKSINFAFDGYNEVTPHYGEKQVGANLLINSPFLDDISVKFGLKSGSKQEASAEVKVPLVGTYQVEMLATTGPKMHIKVETPHEYLPRFGLIYSERKDGDQEYSSNSELYWNNQMIKMTSKLLTVKRNEMLEVVLQTPFEVVKRERLLVQLTREENLQKIALEISHKSDKVFAATASQQHLSNKRDYRLTMETPFASMRSVKFSALRNWEDAEKILKASLVYNEIHTVTIDFSNSVLDTGLTTVVDILAQSGAKSKSMKITHRQSEGVMTTQLALNVGLERPITINNVIRSNGVFELEAFTPFQALSSSKLQLFNTIEGNDKRVGLSAKHVFFNDVYTMDIQGRLRGLEKVQMEVAVHFPLFMQSGSKFVFDHRLTDTGKWETTANLMHGGERIDANSELRIADSEITGTWAIKTPFELLKEMSLQLRHKGVGRFIEHQHVVKTLAVGTRIQVTNSMQLSGLRSIKLTSRLESNIAGYENVLFNARQTIEASPVMYELAYSLGSPAISHFAGGLALKMEPSGFEGAVYFKTPSDALKNFNATVRMSFTDWLYWTVKSTVAFENRKGDVLFEKEFALRGLKTTTANFKLKRFDITQSGTLKIEALRAGTVVVEGKLNNNGENSEASIKLELLSAGRLKGTVQISGMSDIVAESIVTEVSDTVGHSFVVYLGGSEVVSNTFRMTRTSTNGRKFGMKVNTKAFEYKQDTSVEFQLTPTKLNFNASHSCSMIRGPISFNFEAEKRSTGLVYLSANTRLDTPYFEPMTGKFLLNLEHVLKGVTEFDLRLPSVERICYGITWNLLTSMTASVSIELPKIGAIESKMLTEGEEVVLKMEMPKILSEKWELRVGGNVESLSKANLKFRLLTTLPDFKDISIDHMHNFVDDNQINSEVTLPGWTKKAKLHLSISQKKATFQVDIPEFDPIWGEVFMNIDQGNYEMKFVARWKAIFGEQDCELRTKLTSASPVVVSVDAKIPLNLFGYADAVRIKFDGDMRTGPTVAFSADLQYALSTEHPMSQLLKVTCGIEAARRVFSVNIPGLPASIVVSHGNKEMKTRITLHSSALEFSQRSEFNSLEDFEIQAAAKVSGSWTQQVELHLRHQGNWRQFNNKVAFKLDMVSIFDYSGKVDTADGALKAEFDVDMPSTDRMSIRLGHMGQSQSFNQYMEIKSKYHSPLLYRGNFRDYVGEFTATLPILGEASMKMGRVGGKSVVSVYANKDRKVKVEVENAWQGMNGKSSVTVLALDNSVTVTLANEGNSWRQFRTNFSVYINDRAIELSAEHQLYKAIHFSAQLVRPTNGRMPVHLFVISYRQMEKVSLQVVSNYATLFSMNAKLEESRVSSSASLVVQTTIQGLRHTALTAVSTSTGSQPFSSSLKLENDYTGDNVLRLDVSDKSTVKLAFDSSYLGKYSIQIRDRSRIDGDRLSQIISVHPEIEINIHGLEPIQVKFDLNYSPRVVLNFAVQLATSFEGLKNSKVSLACENKISEKFASFKVSQDYIGDHGVSFALKSESDKLTASIDLECDYDYVGGTKFTLEYYLGSVHVKLINRIIGAISFNGKAESKDGAITGEMELQTPWKSISVTKINFEWGFGSESGAKLMLNLKTPLTGENSFVARADKTLSDTEIKTNLHINLYMEKLNERFNLKSAFASKVGRSFITATGSHSIQCSRLGVYSIAEKLQIEESKIYATATVRSPFADWDKTVLTVDVNTKDKTQFTIQFDTKLYGMQDLTFQLSENDLTGHLTILSIRNELTVTGWSPRTDTSSGARYLDLFASVSSPFLKSSGRVNLKKGHFSATANFAMQSKTAVAATSASWEFKPQRILLDLSTSFQMGDFNQVWNAVCDMDFADETTKRLVLKLVSPIASIGNTELTVTLRARPLIEASILVQSPNFGHVKLRAMWHATNGLLTAPISGKLRFEHSFEILPKFEITLDHVQKHENVICDFSIRNLKNGNLLFKADSVLDAFNRKLHVNVGVNQEISIKWQSKSDFEAIKLEEYINVKVNQVDMYSLTAVYNWMAARTIAFKITTPYSGFEKLGAKVVASVSMPFDVTVKLMLPTQELKAQAVLDLTEGLHVRGALKLPGLPEVELAFQAAGTLRKYKFEVTAQYGTKRLSALTNWDMTQDAKFQIKLETPVRNLHLAAINFVLSRSIESEKNIKLAVAFNSYANELELKKESNSKELKFRIHYPGKLVELMLNRLGHETNRGLNVVFNMDDICLIDISTRATSMFSSRTWKIKMPHSGFLEVKKLFGTFVEQSRVEWGYKNVRYSISGQSDLSILLRLKHKESYFYYEMAMLHGGKFSFKTSANVPRYGIRLEELSGTLHISNYGTHDTRIAAELAGKSQKLQLICTTNLRDNIALHLSGLRGATKFALPDSLTLQAHYVRSKRVNEITIKLSGLQKGILGAALSLKRDTGLHQLSVNMEAFKNTLEGHLQVTSRRGWLSSVTEHKLEGRLGLYSTTRGPFSSTWSAKLESGALEADVQVVSGILSDNKLLQSKIVVNFNRGLHANVETSGFGVHGQVIAAMSGNQINIVVKDRATELGSVILSYEKTGYKTLRRTQRIHALYKRQVVFSFESKQETVSWAKQVSVSANLEVAGKVYLRNCKVDVKRRSLNAEVDWHSLKPIKVIVDFESIMKPKVYIAYGSHEILTNMIIDITTGNTLNAELDMANPWMPVKVRLNHMHKPGNHKVKHEYVVGRRAYTVDGYIVRGHGVMSANVECRSPSRKFIISAHGSHSSTHRSFSHSIVYNDVNYLQVDGNLQDVASPQQRYQSMQAASVQLSTGQHQYSRFLPPIRMDMEHHYGTNGWKDSAWVHKASIGDWKASHTGHIDWKSRGLDSRFNGFGHVSEAKVGRGVFEWKHTWGGTNVGTISGTYSKTSSFLKFYSDLTTFHTDVQLDHSIGRRMGNIGFSQTGSHSTPVLTANWNLNRPTFQGQLKVGNAHINLEHVHNSNRDFSCKYSYKHDTAEHAFKGRFVVQRSTRVEFHKEIETHVELTSSLLPAMMFRFQHHHNNIFKYRCAGKIHFGDWKLLHTSTVGIPSRHLTAETYIHKGDVAMFHKKVNFQNGVFTAESQLGSTQLYNFEYHHTLALTNVKLTSGFWNIDSRTAIEHNIVSWRQGKFHASHSGILPQFEASANWHATKSSRQFYSKLLGLGKSVEVDMNCNSEKDKLHFNHMLNSWLGDLKAAGLYDRGSFVRLTELTLHAVKRWQPNSETYTWSHKLGHTGFVKILTANEVTTLHEARANWDFASQKKTFDLYSPLLQLAYKQTSPTSGQISVELHRTTGKHTVTGLLDANSSWKTGQIKLNSSGSVYAGNWNLEEVSKSLVLDLASFKLNLLHNHREAHSFDFEHKMTCDACLLSNMLPWKLETKGKMEAASTFLTGTASARYAINDASPISAKAQWNFANELKVIELIAPMITGRFTHRHASLTDFNFKHTLTVLSTTHSATGDFKIDASPDFGRRIVARMDARNCKFHLEHHHDGLNRHKWNHTAHFGGWRFHSTGHRHPRQSLMSEVSMTNTDTGKQNFYKKFSWEPDHLEYQDAAGGVKYHFVRFVNTDAEKSAWFKSLYYERIVGAGLSVKKTCPTCFQLEMKAASKDNPNLVSVTGEVQLAGYVPLDANSNIETPLGKITIRSKFHSLKLSNLRYVASVSSNTGKLKLDLESQILSVRNVTFNIAFQHSDLLPLPNTHASFSLKHRSESWSNFAQSVQVRAGNGIPFIYSFTNQLVEGQRKSHLSIHWMGSSIVEVDYLGPLYLTVKTSSSVLPIMVVKFQPRVQSAFFETPIDIELRVADKALEGSLTLTARDVSFFIKTPFSTVSKIGAKIKGEADLPKKLSAEIGFELNELSYGAALNFEVEALKPFPRGILSMKIVTPHKPISSLEILAEHRKSVDSRGARVMVAVNGRKLDIVGNVTSASARLHFTLPISGYQDVGFKVYSDEEESQPRVRVRVQLPHGHRGNAQIVWNYDGSSVLNSRINIDTSFERIKTMEISTSNRIQEQVLDHTSSMVVNQQTWHDIQLTADKGKREVALKYMKSVVINYRYNFDKILTTELKVTIGDRVPFHLNTQFEFGSYSVDGKSFLTLRTPYRTVQISREAKFSPKGISYKLEFTPNVETTQPLVFEFSTEDNSDFTKNRYLTKVSLAVPTRRIETSMDYQTLSQESQVSVNLNWDADKPEGNKKLSFLSRVQYDQSNTVAGRFELKFSDRKPYAIEFSNTLGDRRVLHNSTVSFDITNNAKDTITLRLQATQETPDTLQIASSLSQVSSRVDLKINGRIKQTTSMRDGQLSFTYEDSEGKPQVVRSVLQVTSDSIRVELIQPTKRCSFELRRTRLPEYTAYTLTAHEQKLELRLSSAPDLQIIYEPRKNDRLWAAIGYNSRWHLRADVHRVTDQVKTQKLLAEVQQKSKNLLQVKLHWDPTDNLLDYASKQRLADVLKVAKHMTRSLQFECVKDVLVKVARDLILPDMTSGIEAAAVEIQPLKRDLGYMRSQFEDMYARNEFYSRDILQAFSKVASTTFGYAAATVNRGVNAYATHVHPHVKYAMNRVRHHAVRCYGHASRAYGTYLHHRDVLYRKVNEHVLSYTYKAVDSIRPALDAAHSSYQRFAGSYPVATMSELRTRVARSVNQMNYRTFDLLHADIRDKALSVHQSIEAGINHVSDRAAEVVSTAQAQARHHTSRFLNANPVGTLVFGAYAKSKWLLDNFNIEQNLKDFAKENYHQGVEYVRQNTIGLVTDYLGLSKNAILAKDFERGKLEANLYSPMAWTDLKSLPSSGLDEVQDRLAHSYNSMRQSVNTVRRKLTAVRDVVYDSIPDFDMPSGSWIPKFKGIASVIGDHIITFDGRHYDFRGNGECSYLLARDFRDRRWAIGMTYARARKNLDIFVYGKHIRVTPQLHVLLDGVKQELPLNVGNLSVVRSGSGLRAKDLGHLFTVTVDPSSDMHTISVSGWYHGRLGGLLGNFDNEQFNDLTDSTNSRTDNVLEFTGSWRLGPCRHANLASTREVPEGPHPDCVRLFGSTRSPFRRCYTFVDPAPFRDICAQERGTGGSQQLCRAAIAYIRHCDAKGLRGLRAPTQCLRCTVPLPNLSSYRELTDGQKFTTRVTDTLIADVVLVLEERGCIGPQAMRKLPEMVNQIVRSLGAAGVTDVRFGLLGFGNPSHQRGKAVATERSRPHWHTMSGELMGTAEQLTKVLAELKTHDTADASVDGARGSDALEAVRMAARFDELRPGAARHVILVACDECHEGKRSLQSVRESLTESNAQLHLLSETQLPTYFYGRRSQAFGVDSQRAYSLESPAGSPELHGYTRRPTGKCAGLALTTGGTVFDLRFIRRRQYASKSLDFVQTFSDRLASSVVATRATAGSDGYLECRCQASGYETRARLNCRPL